MITSRRCWIFDLDGTLTEAIHDFDALRRELDLPPGEPILEALARLPAAEAQPRIRRLDEIELDLAQRAEAREGAAELLELLERRTFRLGILTRNSRRNAQATLCAAGLERFFAPADVLGRDEAPPKPSPAGVLSLLAAWREAAGEAVVVGNYVFDLQAGRGAGTATVLVSPGPAEWDAWADLAVPDLPALTALLRAPDGAGAG